MPRRRIILSLDTPAYRGAAEDSLPLYATLADRHSAEPIALAEEPGDEMPHDMLEPDVVTLEACELAGIALEDFCSPEVQVNLLRNRIRRFTCTRDDQMPVLDGCTRQAYSKRLRKLLPKARLVIPLRAILSDNVEGFRTWFPRMVTTWKGGPVEQLVQLRPVIEKRGQELSEHFELAARGLLDQTKRQLHDALRLAWDGTESEEFVPFMELYNRLRVSAVFAPRAAHDLLTDLRSRVRSKQFWLIRAVDRSLHLTGKVEASRQWIGELTTLLDFESQVPEPSLATAAYIGVYYADCLSRAEWGSVTHPLSLSSPWEPSALSYVLKESYQNTIEAWYQIPEQSTVNLLRVALYLRCHPDRHAAQRRSKKLVQMIIGRAKKLDLPREGSKAIQFLRGFVG